jgi:hypothetical protein
MIEETAKRVLFVENKVEVLTLPELKRTINAEDIGGLRRTAPVPHFKLIDDLNDILTKAGQAPVVENIYIGKSPGTKLIKQVEQQHGIEKVLDAWLLDRITGKISLPSLSKPDMTSVIAFSYHDKGIDVAFGQNVHDCSNMCIYGSNLMSTYGANKNVDYDKMLTAFSQWCTQLEAMSERDMAIIERLQSTQISGKDMVNFIGKMEIAAVAANIGIKTMAPLNVTQVGEVTKSLLHKEPTMFHEDTRTTLWEFYNNFTYVLKADKSDIVSLLTDTRNIGELILDAFKVERSN